MRHVRPLLLALLLAAMMGSPVAGATDTDGDGLRDTFENQMGVTSSTNADSDDDGVIDAAEDNDNDRLSNRAEQKFGSHPGMRDTDGDGIPDGQEDADRDGRSNAIEQDHRRLPPGLKPLLRSAPVDFSPYKAGCQATFRSSKLITCSYGAASSATTVVLMGDSHAMQLATPIKTVAEENGWRLTTLVKKACPPVLGINNSAQRWRDDGQSCRQWRLKALAWLRNHPPDHIILAHSDGYGIAGSNGKRIKGARRAPVWKAGMMRTLEQMPPSSEVLLLGDIPFNRLNPINCLKLNTRNISKCVTSRRPLHKRAIELALEQAAEARGVRFERFYDQVCSYDPCPILQGTVLIYRDRGHLTATFARRLTPTFRTMLTEFIPPVPAPVGRS